MKERVVVGISGGIDSTAAAFILKQDGFEVFGVTFDFLGDKKVIEKAEKMAKILDIHHEVIPCKKDFEQRVIKPFVENYLNGYTPNPCIICDHDMKFRSLMAYADTRGIALMATGHYLRLEEKDNEIHILKGCADRKDQSYYLYTLNQKFLKRLIFPLGVFKSKEDVKKLLKEAAIDIGHGEESQGICFIPDGHYGRFIRKNFPINLADGRFIESKSNRILGTHQGFYHFTLGQKRKLGLTFEKPYVVVGINPKLNEVILGEESDLMTSLIYLKDIRFISEKPLKIDQEITFKICRWGYLYTGTLTLFNAWTGVIQTEKFVRAPMPGQAAVFYGDNELIGGGIIEYKNKMKIN